MADRNLTNPQLTQIAQQAQISVELLEVDWAQTSGVNAQGRTDGYLTITPGAATTFKYGDNEVWASCTHTGEITVISSPGGGDVETVDYLKRIAFKYNSGWQASVGYTLVHGYISLSDVDPDLTALKVDGKFYINLHYNSVGFYLFDSSNNLITDTSVIKQDRKSVV